METKLQKKINGGEKILIAEIKPPAYGNPQGLKTVSRQYADKICALGVSDNRDGLGMSALAASSIIAGEGIEPIMHMVTRDRNRIALISDCLGAQGLGICNLLLTSGTHHTLGPFKNARSVFDIDSIQLIMALNNITKEAGIIGLDRLEHTDSFFIGGVTDPFADPLELQVIRLNKKIQAGVKYIITKPIFDLGLFDVWWDKVTAAGIPGKIAVIAGIKPLTDLEKVKNLAMSRPDPKIPANMIKRLASAKDKESIHKLGIEIALETIIELSKKPGIRGLAVNGDGDDQAALEVIERSGWGNN